MVRAFACPECGAMVAPAKLGPGRQIRCGQCDTLLEIPFFPRASNKRRRKQAGWVRWAAAGTLAAAALVVVSGLGWVLQQFGPSAQETTSGEAAPLSRGEAESRLAQIEAGVSSDSTGALPQYERLLSLVMANPELTDLASRIRLRRDAVRERVATSLLQQAHRVVETDPTQAVALCERVVKEINQLPPGRGRATREEAQSLVAQIAALRGVILETVSGEFRLGSTPSYNADLHPRYAEALRPHGFVAMLSPDSPFQVLWSEKAPYRLTTHITEEQTDEYLQSVNRITSIEARISLLDHDRVIWHNELKARTQTPLPNLPAYEDRSLALAPHRSPAIEQRFYQNALAILHDRLMQRLNTLPDRPR